MRLSSKNTKQRLALALKELLTMTPFNAISVAMISEAAGVNRTTFYKHFQDKYAVLEWIFNRDLDNLFQKAASRGLKYEEGYIELLLEMFFGVFEENKDFYEKAIHIRGQNSFVDVMVAVCKAQIINDVNMLGGNPNSVLLGEPFLTFYSAGLIAMTVNWLDSGMGIPPGEISSAFLTIMRHSYIDIRDSGM